MNIMFANANLYEGYNGSHGCRIRLTSVKFNTYSNTPKLWYFTFAFRSGWVRLGFVGLG